MLIFKTDANFVVGNNPNTARKMFIVSSRIMEAREQCSSQKARTQNTWGQAQIGRARSQMGSKSDLWANCAVAAVNNVANGPKHDSQPAS